MTGFTNTNPCLFLRSTPLKIFLIGLAFFSIIGLSASETLAQNFNQKIRYQTLPPFALKAYWYKTESEQQNLNIYLKVSKNLLSFIKEGEMYVGRYYLAAMLFDKDGETLLLDKIWRKELVLSTYEESVSRKQPFLEILNLRVETRAYTLEIKLTDIETGREYSVKTEIKSLAYNPEGLAISSLMILDTEKFDSTGKRYIQPRISPILNNEEGATYDLFFELYQQNQTYDSLKVRYAFWRLGNQEFVANKRVSTIMMRPKTTHVFHRIDLNPINGGDYRLNVQVEDFTGKQLASAETSFRVRMSGLAAFIIDLDEAIQQLNYIAEYEEIEPIEEAKTYDEKLELFNAFWKKRDPSPRTEVNELMAEYYSRISYANQHFTTYIKGWRTDMGMIYIKYGAPDFVERQPGNFNNKAFEVWEFHQHRRRFVFIDVNGFGDFRLAVPEWDDRNRMY
jgi:GWxTD domain-containing protein